MARLTRTDSELIRIRYLHTDDKAIHVVSVQDYIDGAYDPADFAIVSYATGTRVAVMDGDSVRANEDGSPVMRTEYDDVDPAEVERINRASLAERKDAAKEAKELIKPAS